MPSSALRCVDTSMANKLRKWLADRAGFYRESPDYIRALKKTAVQEIIYGESAIAIAFAIYTFVFSISLIAVVIAFGAAFTLAGYHIWRPYHLRLQPKLKFIWRAYQEPTKTVSRIGNVAYTVNYVQLLPVCTTDAPVENCRGRLLRVMEWDANAYQPYWAPTVLNEPLDLIWSNHDSQPLTLEPGVNQRLNLLAVGPNQAELQVSNVPLKAAEVFTVDRDFLLQVRLNGKDCPPVDINVKVRFGKRSTADVADGLPAPVEVAIVRL